MTSGERGSLWGILVAGGQGRRIGGDTPKQFRIVRGRMLIAHTLDALSRFSRLEGLTLVVSADLVEWVSEQVPGWPMAERIRVTAGGAERADSVLAGLQTVPPEIESVFVHDAVRPCLSRELIERLETAIREHAAVIPALPPADTVKEVDGSGRVVRTLPRSRLVYVQTPQLFRRGVLERAFLSARSTMSVGAHTDCASLVEASGGTVVTVPGDPDNIKVTRITDFPLVDRWLETAIRTPGASADESWVR